MSTNKKNANNDDRVDSLLQKVKAKKAEIGRIERPAWRTNCTINGVNIQTINDEAKLVQVTSDLLAYEDNIYKARKALGLDPTECIVDRFSVADWTEDLKFRARQLNVSKQKKELEQLENKLKGLMSTERKTKLEIDDIEQLLG